MLSLIIISIFLKIVKKLKGKENMVMTLDSIFIWKKIIQKLISGEKVDVENSGLSKREWNELMSALELKDKLI